MANCTRTAQKCVRNAVRYGSPSLLTVAVGVDQVAKLAELVVSDNGAGFDSDLATDRDSFGLRGLRDLAQEASGTLNVESVVGVGTTVRLEVPTP